MATAAPPVDHDAVLTKAGKDLAAARRKTGTTLEAARIAALNALADGATEVHVATKLGVDRMTVRKWAGKR